MTSPYSRVSKYQPSLDGASTLCERWTYYSVCCCVVWYYCWPEPQALCQSYIQENQYETCLKQLIHKSLSFNLLVWYCICRHVSGFMFLLNTSEFNDAFDNQCQILDLDFTVTKKKFFHSTVYIWQQTTNNIYHITYNSTHSGQVSKAYYLCSLWLQGSGRPTSVLCTCFQRAAESYVGWVDVSCPVLQYCGYNM